MTLLKHEPSAQIPWQKTILGFPEPLTFETSPAFAAGTNVTTDEAPSNAELFDKNPDQMTLRGVLMMSQVCTQPTPVTTHIPICRRICRGRKCARRPAPSILIAHL
jgi:hypothetical protein